MVEVNQYPQGYDVNAGMLEKKASVASAKEFEGAFELGRWVWHCGGHRNWSRRDLMRHCGRKGHRRGGRRRRLPEGFGDGMFLDEAGDGVAEVVEAMLHGRGEGVEPMGVHQGELHGAGGEHVLDAVGDEDFFFADGAFDLAADLRGVIGVEGEDEEDDLAFVEGVDEGGAVLFAGEDVARGDPAGDAMGLERGAGSVGNELVFCGVADEDFVRHSCGWRGVPIMKLG